MYKIDNQTKYAIQLAMLQNLLNNEEINKTEYNAIKATLKKNTKFWILMLHNFIYY